MAPSMKKMTATESLPWIEKYRPNTLDDLIAHTEIISTINRLVDANSLPHLLFYGPPGTGKTSTILACARRLYGNNLSSMVLELNASDDRGINVVRNQIKNFAGTRKLFSSGVKLVILDEADALTRTAQFALRRVIEKYVKNTRFCLICNYANKIIPAIQSQIANAENVNITDDGMESILNLCEGDMRKMLNILQSCHMAYPEVNQENVYIVKYFFRTKVSDVDAIMTQLLNEPFSKAYRNISCIRREKGLAMQDVIKCVFERSNDLVFPPPVKMYIASKLADLENHLAHATSEDIQLGGLVGCFIVAREMIAAEKNKN
eukprot:GSMAST32.ASY1.ANO1.2171.1 assembled CDS